MLLKGQVLALLLKCSYALWLSGNVAFRSDLSMIYVTITSYLNVFMFQIFTYFIAALPLLAVLTHCFITVSHLCPFLKVVHLCLCMF